MLLRSIGASKAAQRRRARKTRLTNEKTHLAVTSELDATEAGPSISEEGPSVPETALEVGPSKPEAGPSVPELRRVLPPPEVDPSTTKAAPAVPAKAAPAVKADGGKAKVGGGGKVRSLASSLPGKGGG